MSHSSEAVAAQLSAAAGAVRAVADAAAATAGLTGARWAVLRQTAASSGPYTVPQIARRLGVSRQNVQRLVDELLADGLVVLRRNADHRTSPHVLASSAGLDALAVTNSAAAALHRHIDRELSSEDLAHLGGLLHRFASAATSALDR